MEKALLTSGRIIAGLLVVVAVLLLVVLIVGTSFVQAAVTIPVTITRTLADEDFYTLAAQAALTKVLESLPPEIQTVGAAIRNTAVLIDGLRNADLSAVSRQIVPREWLQQQLVAALTQPRQSAGADSQVGLLRGALQGEAGRQVARLVVAAARECTDREVQLLDRLRSGEARPSIIGFICNPPTLPDVDLGAVMQDVVVVSLAAAANQIAEDIPNPFEDVDLQSIGVDTRLGRLSLQWPALHLDTGLIDFDIPLPEAFQQSVETSVTQVRSTVQAASDQVGTQVAESRGNLEALGTEVILLNPSPTPPPTEPPVIATRPAVEATETNLLAGVLSPIAASVETTLATLNARLNDLAASVNQILILVCGGSLVLLTIAVLYLVRTFRDVGLWLGVVLPGGGIVIILLNSTFGASQVVTYPTDANLSEANAQLRAMLADAVSSAVHSELTGPLQTSGIILVLLGAALLAYLYYTWRRSTPSGQVPVTDSQEQPV